MRAAWTLPAAGMLLYCLIDAGSAPLTEVPTNTVATTSDVLEDSTTNLLQAKEFFVCSSLISGMDGRYVLYEDADFRADRNTPVFARDDEDDEQLGQALSSTAEAKSETDFRLFRRNGFWMFADVAPWPPVTLFRCDPTKNHVPGVDFAGVCGMNLATPPLFGYSPSDISHSVAHLTLRTGACDDGDSDTKGLGRVVVVQTNLSGRKDEL